MADKLQSHVFNIGTGVGATLRDFERALRRRLPKADIQIGPGLNFFNSPYPASGVYDISRAERELGYEPQYDVEKGVADYLQSLERMGD